MSVSFREDEYVRELQDDLRTAVWVAGLVYPRDPRLHLVYMDDSRPGVEPHSAWLRLREHLAATGGRITNLSLKFRSNSQWDILPQRADGYFFCKSAVRTDGLSEMLSFVLVGALTQGKLMVQRWKVPELLLIDEGLRDPDLAGECLIRNPTREA